MADKNLGALNDMRSESLKNADKSVGPQIGQRRESPNVADKSIGVMSEQITQVPHIDLSAAESKDSLSEESESWTQDAQSEHSEPEKQSPIVKAIEE